MIIDRKRLEELRKLHGSIRHDDDCYRICNEFGPMADTIEELMDRNEKIQAVVDAQAEDEVLWTLNLDGTLPITEAYLQQELRRLHAVIEDKP